MGDRMLTAVGQSTELKLTLKEAQAYAIDHNKMVTASKMDVEASSIALKEMITNVLPQINATGNFNDNLKLMTTLIPAEFFGGTAGDFIPAPVPRPVCCFSMHLSTLALNLQNSQ